MNFPNHQQWYAVSGVPAGCACRRDDLISRVPFSLVKVVDPKEVDKPLTEDIGKCSKKKMLVFFLGEGGGGKGMSKGALC